MRKINEKIDQDVEGEGENVENEEWVDVEEKEKNDKNQDVGIPYPFRKPKKHTQTGTGTRPETGAKIKTSFGSQQITHSELKFRKMSIFVQQKCILFFTKNVHFLPISNLGEIYFYTQKKV